MKTSYQLASSVAFGVVCGLLGAGLIILALRPPRGTAIVLAPPPTAIPVVVYINGAVTSPGVYSLPAGSRLQDAVQAAGGLLTDADSESLNLAAILQDGVQIWVALKGQTSLLTSSKQFLLTQVPDQSPSQFPSRLININTATLEELDSLPDIGLILAQKIIDYRQTNGFFATIEEIMLVPDIGPVTFEKIKDMISIVDTP